MKTPSDYSIDMAYSYSSPDDLRRYYNDSAKGYDEFAMSVNYILPSLVVSVALEYFGNKPERAIDVGCGTGLVGVAVGRQMPELILEGIDISSEMIYEAYNKKRINNSRCYSSIIIADATKEHALLDNRYTLLLSAGTFTLGHLMPHHFDLLLNSLVPDGMAVISIKKDHYENEDFLGHFSKLKENKTISIESLITVDSYSNPEYSAESVIAVIQKRQ